MGGNLRGGRIDLKPEVDTMVKHQIRVGGLVEGDTAIIKIGGDGTSITKKEQATVHTATMSNSKKALQISTLSIVMGPEEYKVNIFVMVMQVFLLDPVNVSFSHSLIHSLTYSFTHLLIYSFTHLLHSLTHSFTQI